MHKVGRKFPLTKKAHTHKHVLHKCYFPFRTPIQDLQVRSDSALV